MRKILLITEKFKGLICYNDQAHLPLWSALSADRQRNRDQMYYFCIFCWGKGKPVLAQV